MVEIAWDKYDYEIAELADGPPMGLATHWQLMTALFRLASPSDAQAKRPDGEQCGCLTMIRATRDEAKPRVAWTPELTREIQADTRIPTQMASLQFVWLDMSYEERVAALQPFAEWQRRLDREIRNVKVQSVDCVGDPASS